jgi:hypothetical protein
MFKYMKRIFALAFAVLAFAQLQAQNTPTPTPPAPHHRHHHAAGDKHGGRHAQRNPEMRAARKAFFDEKAMPVMTAQHKIMLSKLSAADLKFIETKRAEQIALRQKMRLLRQEMGKAHKSGASPETIQAQFDSQIKAQHAEQKAFYESMQAFIDKNKTTLDPIHAELKKVHDAWKTERKALHDKQNPNAPKHDGKAKGAKPHHHATHPHRAMRHAHRFVDFILWDGTSNPMPQKPSPEERRNAQQLANPLHVQAFPNPAQNQTTLSMQLPKTANSLTIRIVDAQGKTVHTHNMKSVAAGDQKIQLDLSQIPAGTYFCSVIADDQTAATTIVISK